MQTFAPAPGAVTLKQPPVAKVGLTGWQPSAAVLVQRVPLAAGMQRSTWQFAPLPSDARLYLRARVTLRP